MFEITDEQLLRETEAISDYLLKQTGGHLAPQQMLENCNDIITRAKNKYPKETEDIKPFQDTRPNSTRYESVVPIMIRLKAILEYLAGKALEQRTKEQEGKKVYG